MRCAAVPAAPADALAKCTPQSATRRPVHAPCHPFLHPSRTPADFAAKHGIVCDTEKIGEPACLQLR